MVVSDMDAFTQRLNAIVQVIKQHDIRRLWWHALHRSSHIHVVKFVREPQKSVLSVLGASRLRLVLCGA